MAIPSPSNFAPGSSAAELGMYDIKTATGRRRLFHRRIDEIQAAQRAAGRTSNLDEALFELRTSEKPEDRKLLELMGVATGWSTSEKLRQERHLTMLGAAAEQSARGTALSPEAKAALKAANARQIAFNSRLDELMAKGFSIDQAILQMRANPIDARLLAEMGGS
jgi:hypothetical protein